MTDLYYAGYADALRYALRILDRDGTPSPEVRRYIIDEIASAERCARHVEKTKKKQKKTNTHSRGGL